MERMRRLSMRKSLLEYQQEAISSGGPSKINVQFMGTDMIYQLEMDPEKSAWDCINTISNRFQLTGKKIQLYWVNYQNQTQPFEIERTLESLGAFLLIKVKVVDVNMNESRLSRKESFLAMPRRQSSKYIGVVKETFKLDIPTTDIYQCLEKNNEKALSRQSTRRRSSIINNLNQVGSTLKRLVSFNGKRPPSVYEQDLILEDKDENPIQKSSFSLHGFLNFQGLKPIEDLPPLPCKEETDAVFERVITKGSNSKYRNSVVLHEVIQESSENEGETQLQKASNNTQNEQQQQGVSSRQHSDKKKLSKTISQLPNFPINESPVDSSRNILNEESSTSIVSDIGSTSAGSSILERHVEKYEKSSSELQVYTQKLSGEEDEGTDPVASPDFYGNILSTYQNLPESNIGGYSDLKLSLNLANNPIKRSDGRLSYYPKLDLQSSGSSASTLRKNNATARPRVQSSISSFLLNTETPKRLIKVYLSDGQRTSLKMSDEVTMEDMLDYVCKKRGFEPAFYTFVKMDSTVAIEMDRNLGYYSLAENVAEFKMIEAPKTYTTMAEKEGDREVMVYKVSEGNFFVLSASIEKLYEQLTDQDYKDEKFLELFLLTFRSYMTPTEAFARLLDRFDCVLPTNPSKEDIEYYKTMKRPTQERVVEILRRWIEHHWQDFGVDFTLKNELHLFVNRLMMDKSLGFQRIGHDLRNCMAVQSDTFDEIITSYKAVERRGKRMESMFAKISQEDISEQLCLHNFKLFKNIKPTDFLQQIWRPRKPDEETSTPMLDFFIARFDIECHWVATEIVSVKDFKQRVATLKKVIRVAKLCLEYKNFFSFFAIIGGLNLGPVLRMKKTWEALSDKTKKTHTELMKVIDPSRNMKHLRDIVAEAVPPMIPFLPIYLKDLTFMNDGNPSKIKDMINFEKLRMMGNCVKGMSDLAKFDFKFKPKPEIQNYLSKPPVEIDLQKLKQMSLQCEPLL